jgi:hypothetical protein
MLQAMPLALDDNDEITTSRVLGNCDFGIESHLRGAFGHARE